jgi:hypothetical protein
MQHRTHASARTAPLYDVDWINGRAIEVFFADEELARPLGGCSGWYWWECYPGCLPESDAFGPFTTGYRALKDAIQARRLATMGIGR